MSAPDEAGQAGIWAAPAWGSEAARGFGTPPRPRRTGGQRARLLCGWFSLGLFGAASVVLFPIGLVVLPAVLIAGAVLVVRHQPWPEIIVGLTGVAAFTGFVAYRNRDSRPCSQSSTTVSVAPDDFSTYSCGGTSAEPWVAATLLLLGTAIVVYAVALFLERRQQDIEVCCE